ncbi:MAG: hypothetical protein WCJ70_02030 [bacterium]
MFKAPKNLIFTEHAKARLQLRGYSPERVIELLGEVYRMVPDAHHVSRHNYYVLLESSKCLCIVTESLGAETLVITVFEIARARVDKISSILVP